MGSEAIRLTNVDIDNALDNNHFQVIFQPIFHLGNGALIRVESFVRWTHPGLGVLPPGAFISFFESQGRMGELTRYVLSTALKAYMEWRGAEGPGFSINLAQSDVLEADFAKWLTATLKQAAFPPDLLTLECPALPASTSMAEAKKCFARLRKTGCRLAIEVRGRANDLLRTIDPFPFDELKTGGSAILRFARTMRGGPGLTAISELLDLSQTNDATIIAVGVEDEASLKALAGLGFTAAQGNYLSTIGDLDKINSNIVNKIRKNLDLETVSGDELKQLMLGGENRPAKTEARLEQKADKAEESPAQKPAATPRASKSGKSSKAVAASSEQKALVPEKGRLTPEKMATLKKRAAQVAAKRRAGKKADKPTDSDAPEASQPPDETTKPLSEEATATLEEQKKAVKEAKARQEADENARKLQSRLSRAYEVSDKQEHDDDQSQAGLLLGGPLNNTIVREQSPQVTASDAEDEKADERPAPEQEAEVIIESRSTDDNVDEPDDTESVTEAVTDKKVPESKKESQEEKGDTAASEKQTAAAMVNSAQPAPEQSEKPAKTESLEDQSASDQEGSENSVSSDGAESQSGDEKDDKSNATSLPHFRSGLTSSLRLSSITDLPAEKPSISKAVETENQETPGVSAAEHDDTAAAEALPAPQEQEEMTPDTAVMRNTAETVEPSPEDPSTESDEMLAESDPEDFRPEDEVLDEAFEGSDQLDPTELHEDNYTDDTVEIDSTERDIAHRLKGLNRRKRKNWLMRRHRLVPNHFWPKSWKRKWMELRDDDDADPREEPLLEVDVPEFPDEDSPISEASETEKQDHSEDRHRASG